MAAFVKLLVADIAASVAFYEAMGFVNAGQDGVTTHLRWNDNGHVYLVKTPPTGTLEGKRGTGVLLGFTTKNPDVTALAQRAANLGCKVDGPRVTPWHTREFVVTDPDGYRLTFVEPA